MSKGFSFGSKPAGSTGFSFGGATSTASNTAQAKPFSFGSTATTAQSTGFSFGQTKPATTQASGGFSFGGGGFGAKTTTTASTGLFGGTGFGAKTTAASSTGGGLFGGSSFGAKATGTGLFGGTSAFGKTTTTTASSGFGGFSFNKSLTTGATGFGGGLGQQQQQQAPQDSAAAQLLASATALSAPVLFSDERDAIVTKWNQVQAFWGTGKGYYRKDGSCIEFTPQNHFCRFKAVGYSLLPTHKDEKGLVSLVCGKKEDEMRQVGDVKIAEAIHKILGGNAALKVKVQSISSLPNDKCEVTIYITEQSAVTGQTRRVLASELARFLLQQNYATQLKQQLAVESCQPRAAWTPEQISNLLANPPAGIDPVIWEQAKQDNPDPKTIIPVPMVGFSELRSRLQHQEFMAKQHQTRLDMLSQGLHKIQQEQTNMHSSIEQYKRKLLELSHRLLQVIIAQEIFRKSGYAIQPEEEALKVKLESLIHAISIPNKFRGRLNELLPLIRMQQPAASHINSNAHLDQDSLEEIKSLLKKQQAGLNEMVKIVQSDFKDLKVIESSFQSEDTARGPSPLSYLTVGR